MAAKGVSCLLVVQHGDLVLEFVQCTKPTSSSASNHLNGGHAGGFPLGTGTSCTAPYRKHASATNNPVEPRAMFLDRLGE